MQDCIFCKLVKGEIPSAKVYEDKDVLAFLDIGPVNKGHTLVIPKKHYETIWEIPDKTLEVLITKSKTISKAIEKALKADGVNIMISNRKAAGQLVPHAHIHIIPRHEGDGFKYWAQGKYEEGEMQSYAEMIKKNL